MRIPAWQSLHIWQMMICTLFLFILLCLQHLYRVSMPPVGSTMANKEFEFECISSSERWMCNEHFNVAFVSSYNSMENLRKSRWRNAYFCLPWRDRVMDFDTLLWVSSTTTAPAFDLYKQEQPPFAIVTTRPFFKYLQVSENGQVVTIV